MSTSVEQYMYMAMIKSLQNEVESLHRQLELKFVQSPDLECDLPDSE